MIKQNSLILGDCLEVMKDIPDHSVNMILCDLPYGVTNKSNQGSKWDIIIPFEPLWNEYNRIAKDNAAIVLFGKGKFTAMLMESSKNWRYNLIWDKLTTTNFLNCNRQFLPQHEDICVFYNKQPTYHPQMIKGKMHQRIHGNLKNNVYGKYDIQKEKVVTDEYYPSSILSFCDSPEKRTGEHPTEKPVPLLQYLIRTFTNEGDLVLDNTMGVGSTCVAAKKESRSYIGIEKDQRYYDIARLRIKLLDYGIEKVKLSKNKKGDNFISVSGELGKSEPKKLMIPDIKGFYHDKVLSKEQLAIKYFPDGFVPKKESRSIVHQLKV